MSELIAYKNLHCRFIHDDRARYCAKGDVAWLRPARANRILSEMEARGIEAAIVKVEEKKASDSVSDSTPPDSSPSIRDRVLLLNAKNRRAIARSLGAPKNVKTSDANALISDASEEELKTASIVYLEG